MRAAILTAVLAAAVGCDSNGSMTKTTTTTPGEKKTDIKIDTPGTKIDIKSKKTDESK